MSKQRSGSNPVIDVTLDAETTRVFPVTADLLRYDMTRERKKWPTPSSGPIFWLTYLAWSAMRREGETDLSFDEFTKREDLDIEPVSEDELTPLNPTSADRYREQSSN